MHVGVQISIHRNDRALMVFTQGPKNTWIMMETNSLRERKQTLKFFFFIFPAVVEYIFKFKRKELHRSGLKNKNNY